MSDYIAYVPVVGFAVEAVRTVREQHACMASNDYFGPICNHEWDTFDQFNVSLIVTSGFLVFALIALRILLMFGRRIQQCPRDVFQTQMAGGSAQLKLSLRG